MSLNFKLFVNSDVNKTLFFGKLKIFWFNYKTAK